MTPEDLRTIGEALYGSHWQSDLARELGMSDRHMRRLAAGTAEVLPGVAQDILRICEARASRLRSIVEQFRAPVASRFAERVLAVARALKTPFHDGQGYFPGQVAIAQVYDAYRQAYPDAGTLESFKERLVTAAKARELCLVRLDMPQYMNIDLRQRSEAMWGTYEVHFVETGK